MGPKKQFFITIITTAAVMFTIIAITIDYTNSIRNADDAEWSGIYRRAIAEHFTFDKITCLQEYLADRPRGFHSDTARAWIALLEKKHASTYDLPYGGDVDFLPLSNYPARLLVFEITAQRDNEGEKIFYLDREYDLKLARQLIHHELLFASTGENVDPPERNFLIRAGRKVRIRFLKQFVDCIVDNCPRNNFTINYSVVGNSSNVPFFSKECEAMSKLYEGVFVFHSITTAGINASELDGPDVLRLHMVYAKKRTTEPAPKRGKEETLADYAARVKGGHIVIKIGNENIPNIPDFGIRQYHMGMMAAKIIVLFFSYDVLMGELRGNQKWLCLNTIGAFAIVSIKGFCGL